MDEKVLEFWGQMLLQAAQGKKQTDQFMQWMQKGFSDSEAFSTPEMAAVLSPFLKFYGLAPPGGKPDQSEDYLKMCEKAMTDFQNTFRDSLALMGVVPQKEHLELIRKYEALKEKCADQEETVKHLKMLLSSQKSEKMDETDFFQEMVKNQSALFQKAVQDFGSQFKQPKKNEDTDGRSETEKDDDQASEKTGDS